MSRRRLILAGFLFIGLLLRGGGITQQSMTHYDEFYYAHSGLWVLLGDAAGAEVGDGSVATPALFGMHPMLPFHAPPLYPTLIGIVYLVIGGLWYPAGALVSALAGTATILVVNSIGRRAGGDGLGLFAAGAVALSDFHIAYSRMWLTDATFGLFFALAIYCLLRLIQRPRWLWAALLGLATGAAWQTKYNGWMPISIGIAALLIAYGRDRLRRQTRQALLQPTAMLLVVGGIAAACFAPWYLHVERHFPRGYASVLKHHRSFSTLAQLRQQDSHFASLTLRLIGQGWRNATQLLEAMPVYRHLGWCGTLIATAIAAVVSRRSAATSVSVYLILATVATVFMGSDGVLLLAAVVAVPVCLWRGSTADMVLAVWWAAFAVSVPLYHAYPRLLLPAVLAAPLLAGRGYTLLFKEASSANSPRRLPMAPSLIAGAIFLLSLRLGRFDVGELRGLWASWSSQTSYRAFGDLIARKTPANALIICRTQPTLWFVVLPPREYKGPDDEPLLDDLPAGRPCYLALDFHVHATPTALQSAVAGADLLQEVGRIPNELTPPALLNFLHPRLLWPKMSARATAKPADESDGPPSKFPPDLNTAGPDWIVLYRVLPIRQNNGAANGQAAP